MTRRTVGRLQTTVKAKNSLPILVITKTITETLVAATPGITPMTERGTTKRVGIQGIILIQEKANNNISS